MIAIRPNLQQICKTALFVKVLFAVTAIAQASNPSPLTSALTAEQLSLPDPVPYLNKKENFIIGNGTVAAGGDANGRWNFLCGPDYTCPNYLGSEELVVLIDGQEKTLTLDMHRARRTGLFYGITTIGDLEICLVDYGIRFQPWIARLIIVKNASQFETHSIGIEANIKPKGGAGRTATLAQDSSGRYAAISLQLDTSLKCANNTFCQNWANRWALISFSDPETTVTSNGGDYTLSSEIKNIAPEDCFSVALYHYLHYDGESNPKILDAVRSRDPRQDVADDIHEWERWFDDVDANHSLARIPEGRARDIVEGGLATIKMNQTKDGGIVADEGRWNMSYVRDAYCGLRGLGANGHFDEIKRFIEWQDHKYHVHGFIANADSCGSDSYAHPNGNTGGPCKEANKVVEVTALYLLMARDYYRGTHDLQTLVKANASLQYAMDVQLKEAIANHFRLEFSGDETELCGGAVDVSASGYNRDLSRYWSMTSVALCIASLDFYIQYLNLKGDDPTSYSNLQDHRTLDLYQELKEFQDAFENDFWRTDVAGIPGGFHDSFRVKSDQSWPNTRITNFTLFPLYYGSPLKFPERAYQDVSAIKPYLITKPGLLPLLGNPAGGSLGHDLGYLLWGLVAVGDPDKKEAYEALINGPTVSCWGCYNEAYTANGAPTGSGLRTFETGVNISAIAKYWSLGQD